MPVRRLRDEERLEVARGDAVVCIPVYGAVGDFARCLASVLEHSARSEEHTSELQSHVNIVCRLLLEKKKYIALYFPVTPPPQARQPHCQTPDRPPELLP